MTINRPITNFIALALAVVSCSGSVVGDNPPGPAPPPPPPTPPVVMEWEKNVPSYPAESGTNIVLSADKSSETYSRIDATGFSSVESPDRNLGNHGYGTALRHITQASDEFLGRDVFLFHIHAQQDKDRNTAATDRQRNEIKCDAGSPANMQGQLGDRHHYRWKFCLPADFRPTGSFTHLHQLKGVGGSDIDQPIITLTARHKASANTMQLIHKSHDNDIINYLAEVPLADFLGEWVIVDQWASFTPTGQYTFRIVRLRDGKVLMFYASKSLHLFREGSSFTRPKYGIYRNTTSASPLIKDEIVKFADFELREITQ